MAAIVAAETHPHRSKLSYSAAGSSYTDLTEARMYKLPGFERGKTDITKLDSTAMWRECIGSWKEPGTVGGELYFLASLYNTFLATIMALAPENSLYYWKFTFPLLSSQSTASTLILNGYLSKLDFNEISVASDDALAVPFEIQCSGAPTFTAGS